MAIGRCKVNVNRVIGRTHLKFRAKVTIISFRCSLGHNWIQDSEPFWKLIAKNKLATFALLL